MKLRPFELALALGFGLLGLLAIGLLAGYRPSPSDTSLGFNGAVTVWGTQDAGAFRRTLEPYIKRDEAYQAIRYVEKSPQTINSELLNALAENRGPDLILLPHEDLVSQRSKLQPIPYENFPLRDFRNLYIEGTEIFLMQDGVYAYPVAIDPLVMYWNRDLMTTRNVLVPPRTWEEVVNTTVPTFVQRDFNRAISLSPIAFGEYRNVNHAFAILSLLLIQGGSSLVVEQSAGFYKLQLNQTVAGTRPPLEAALAFFTSFSTPSSPLYSWNRALPLDVDEFVAGDLVLYFGKGSEARTLSARNPNLNIDIAEVPQGANASLRRTYGTFYGWALLRNAQNKQGAFLTLQLLGSEAFASTFATELGLAPAHRQALLAGSNDLYGRIVYSSAVVARAWWNPSLESVDTIFTQMVEDVLAGRQPSSEAAGDAIGRLQQQY